MTSLEEYQIQRDDFHKEHQLVSNRSTWFMASQSFLVTAYVLASPSAGDVQRLLPYLGFLISCVTFASVIAAAKAMSDLRTHIQRLVAEPELVNLPGWGNRNLHRFGMAPPVVIPILFCAFWAYCALR